MTLQPTDLSHLSETDRRRVRRYRVRIPVSLDGLSRTPRCIDRDVELPADATLSRIYSVCEGQDMTHIFVIHSLTFDPVPEASEPPDVWFEPWLDKPVAEAEPVPLTW
jgi:hypothetical protein